MYLINLGLLYHEGLNRTQGNSIYFPFTYSFGLRTNDIEKTNENETIGGNTECRLMTDLIKTIKMTVDR